MKSTVLKVTMVTLLVLTLLALPLLEACGGGSSSPAPASSSAAAPAKTSAAAPATTSQAASSSAAPAPSSSAAVKPAAERTITVGMIAGFTGPLAVPTKLNYQISKAYYDWASQNIIKGVKIDMPTEDTRYDASQTVIAYNRMLPKNPMMIQFIYSQDGDNMRPLCDKDKIPAVGYVTSSLGVTPPGYVFSASPLWDNYMIMVMNWVSANWDMAKQGRKARFASLSWDNTMGKCGIEPGKAYAATLPNLEYVSQEVAPPQTMDFSTYMTRLKSANPDYIWCPMVSGPFSSALKTAMELGMKPSQFIAAGSTTGQWEAVVGAIGTKPLEGVLHACDQYQYSDKAAGIQLLVDLWKKNYPNEALPIVASDWMWGIGPLFSIPEAIRIAIKDVGIEKLDSAALYAALQKIDNYDTKGMAPITYNATRRDGIRSMRMYVWKDNDFQLTSDKLYEAKPTAAEALAGAKK